VIDARLLMTTVFSIKRTMTRNIAAKKKRSEHAGIYISLLKHIQSVVVSKKFARKLRNEDGYEADALTCKVERLVCISGKRLG
jgi:hypothetical protein